MGNNTVKFTIITITYNAAQWLERTILSILSQSYGNIEYVIIDGASTDGTVDIIRQYAPGVSFWLSEPDKGLYDAMNKGLQHATGDYVWFINAGDTLPHADIIQRIVQKIEKRKHLPDVIYGETAIVDAQGKMLGMRRLRPPKKLFFVAYSSQLPESWREFDSYYIHTSPPSNNGYTSRNLHSTDNSNHTKEQFPAGQ